MSDPIWLDTNTLDLALKGDPGINDQLSAYRKQGRQLLVPPAVANEILNGNVHTMSNKKPVWHQTPTAQNKAWTEMGMKRIGVEVDWSSRQVARGTRVDYSMIAVDNVSISDRVVLGQVKAGAQARGIAHPQMITDERGMKGMMGQSKKWSIESIPAAKTPPGSGLAPYPRVNLADYPTEGKGPILRFFNDIPFLKGIGLIGLNILAQYISQKMLDAVEEHFMDALTSARKELETKYPEPQQLKLKAHLDRYRQTYNVALDRVRAPSRQRDAVLILTALTAPRDLPRVKKQLDEQISRVNSAADGSLSGYSKVAQQYIDAMITVYKQASPTEDLASIAADIEKRGSVIHSVGDKLDKTFWKVIPVAAVFPAAYYEWMQVHTVAEIFLRVGTAVLAFAVEIRERNAAYAQLVQELDDELIRVSNELGKYELVP